MIKISFLKKDDLAYKIYKTIWKNRRLWYIPYKKELGGHFQGVHTSDKDFAVFIHDGKLYVEKNSDILINIPNQNPVFTDEELDSTIKVEKVDFERKSGEGKFLTKDNFKQQFELIEV